MQAEVRSLRLKEVGREVQQRGWCLMKQCVAQSVIERLPASAHPVVGNGGHREAVPGIGADYQPGRSAFPLAGEHCGIDGHQVG